MTADARGVAAEDAAVVDQLEELWLRIASLGAELDDRDWKRPTDLPGWTVQDNLTHLTDVELRLLGEKPLADELDGDPPHVRNEMGRRNEVFVDARRAWAGDAALAEFVEVTDARRVQLRGFGPDDFAASSWTPLGPGTVRDMLALRVFDTWAHEQDMRRAVGRPGGLAGPAAEATMDRIVALAPFVVGAKVAPPDGTEVVVECGPPLARTFAVRMEGRRAEELDEPPADPTVRLVLDGETYAMLTCGRVDPAALIAAGRITLHGDAELGRRVVEELNVLF
jgi:uncharacterized protein (TIGR03083 family)